MYAEHDIDLAQYWNIDGVKVPAKTDYLLIYSKVPIEYGYLVAHTKYPDMTGWGYDDYAGISLGFELNWPRGHAAWGLGKYAGTNQLSAHVSGAGVYSYRLQTVSLPTDYLTAKHGYWVKINKHQIWFGIDTRIRTFVLLTKSGIERTLYDNSKPYTIYIAPFHIPENMFAHIEVANIRRGGQHVGLNWPDFTPSDVNWVPGDPLPPLSLPLYVEASDTLLAGQSIAAGSIRSHPIPVFGYRGKTLYFMADQSSATNGLVLEVFTLAGNWRTYDAITYTAGKLLAYQIAGDALLARLTYTPSAYPATINEAEAVLT